MEMYKSFQKSLPDLLSTFCQASVQSQVKSKKVQNPKTKVLESKDFGLH